VLLRSVEADLLILAEHIHNSCSSNLHYVCATLKRQCCEQQFFAEFISESLKEAGVVPQAVLFYPAMRPDLADACIIVVALSEEQDIAKARAAHFTSQGDTLSFEPCPKIEFTGSICQAFEMLAFNDAIVLALEAMPSGRVCAVIPSQAYAKELPQAASQPAVQ
jgi:hypothetical protein